jgi:transcriptional regulator with XRE-family HTH domain
MKPPEAIAARRPAWINGAPIRHDLQINWPLLVEEALRRRHARKLTQKQLAALADVAPPTISRFELVAQDIQLSSALAIFEVLGMIDTRTLSFDQRAPRLTKSGIVFYGGDGHTKLRFRISGKALEDHFSQGNRLNREAAFRKHRRAIEGLARRKYFLGQREPDGSIVIRTVDIA